MMEIELRFEPILVSDTIEQKRTFRVCIKLTRFPASISNLSDICGSDSRVDEDSSLLVFDNGSKLE